MKKYLRVLFIEDEEHDRTLVRLLLSKITSSKFHIDCIGAYEAGLEAICRAEYDVAILDYRSGDRAERELLHEVRARGCTTPLILITEQEDRDSRTSAFAAGAAFCINREQLDVAVLESSILRAAGRKRREVDSAEHRDHLEMTERKKAEDELRRTRDQLDREKSLLHAVLSQMPSGVIVAEPGGQIVLSNNLASEILRHPQMTGHRDEYSQYRPFHPDGRTYEPEEYLLTRSLRDGEIITDEEIGIHLPGGSETRTLLASSSPVIDPAGNIIAAVLSFQDITERKQAELGMHRREQEYRALVENSPDVVMRLDRNLRRIFANRALETVTGFPLSRLLGLSIKEPFVPNRDEYISLMEKACERVFSTGNEEAFEYPYPTAAGSRHFYMRVVPEYSREGSIESVLTISRDVTELRLFREELRKARDELELRVLERTAELAEANRAMRLDEARLEALWNLSQMHEVSTREVADFTLRQQIRLTRSNVGAIGFINGEGAVFRLYSCTEGFLGGDVTVERPLSLPVESVPLLQRILREQEPIVVRNLDARDFGALCPPASLMLRQFMCAPLMEEERVLAVAMIGDKDEEYDSSDVRQVTLLLDGMWKLVQRRKAEKALREAGSLAAMGKALSAVAHDLRVPLVAIGGLSRLVRDHLDKGCEDHAKLEIVISEVRRLEMLLKNILDFSRPLELEKSLQDVNLVILESLAVMENEARQRNLRLETRLSDIPPIYFDPARMKQVIINLVINALQASLPGKTVSISTHLRGKNILIDVADCGCGIPVHKRDEIFAPFVSTKKEGTGLGLPISLKIIDAHRGGIQIVDNVTEGTTFRVIFPATTEKHASE